MGVNQARGNTPRTALTLGTTTKALLNNLHEEEKKMQLQRDGKGSIQENTLLLTYMKKSGRTMKGRR